MSQNIIKRHYVVYSLLLMLVLFPIYFYEAFGHHFYAYLSGSMANKIIMGKWPLVVVCIVLGMAFWIPLSFRRKTDWSEYSLVAAFFVSLFVEMFGIPLTIYLSAKFFFDPALTKPEHVMDFSFLGVKMGMDLPMFYGTILMIMGVTLIGIGWYTLYKNIKNEGLVTNGIYAYSRHPQYLGFLLFILGWFVGWPTILTVVFTPILLYKYISICRVEEKEVDALFPEYKEYKERVPFFI